jgi:branched-chain amino acid transport system permease protein
VIQQLFWNSLVSAAVYALVAVGFALIYRTAGMFHFAHASVFTSGAYLALVLSRLPGLPLVFGVAVAVLLSGLLGCAMELAVYSPLRRWHGSPLAMLLVSIGLYVIMQNAVSGVFGDDFQTLPGIQAAEGIRLGSARITPVQVLMLVASFLSLVAVLALERGTRLGRAMRAVASDPELAGISGVRTGAVTLASFGIGSALAGLAGILAALDTAMTPEMGLNAFLMAAAALIVGGVESILGIAFGALLVGMAQHFGAALIGSQWQDAIAFGIILLFLVIRPRGLLGRRGERAAV